MVFMVVVPFFDLVLSKALPPNRDTAARPYGSALPSTILILSLKVLWTNLHNHDNDNNDNNDNDNDTFA